MDIEKKLPAYVLIDTGHLKKLTNVLHMQLNDMLYQVVSAVPKETVNLTDKILKEWQNKIAVEVEQNNALSASQYTKQLQTLNIERDQILIHFFSIIRSQCYSPDADMRAAAERVNVILGSYRGIQREGIESKSGHIKGLLEDVKKCTAELVKFGLNGTVNQLREKNEKFDQLDMQRSQDLSAENLPNASKARLETDDVFMLICQYIQGSYLFSKNDDDKRAIVHLVDGMNGIVSTIRTSYRNGISQRRNGDENRRQEIRQSYTPLLRDYESSHSLREGLYALTGKVTGKGTLSTYEAKNVDNEEKVFFRIDKVGNFYLFEKKKKRK